MPAAAWPAGECCSSHATAALTRRTMPIVARVVENHLLAAVIALLNASAHFGGAARSQRSEHLTVRGRQPIAKAGNKRRAVTADHFPDAQPRCIFRRGCPHSPSNSFSGSRSNTWQAAWR